MAFVKEILLLLAVTTLLIYLLTIKDNEYVPIADRPQPLVTRRNVINYYGWKGPMFIDDFNGAINGDGNDCNERSGDPDNPLNELVPVSRPNPYLNSPGSTPCTIPKYNTGNDKMKYCHRVAQDKCRVNTLTSEQDWYNEYWNSTYRMTGPSDQGSLCRPPNWRLGDPGNFRQATNNNLDAPNNLKCQARSIFKDYCHPRDKVSPACYAQTLNECLDEMLPDRK
jgi:hypothetical protein